MFKIAVEYTIISIGIDGLNAIFFSTLTGPPPATARTVAAAAAAAAAAVPRPTVPLSDAASKCLNV